MATIQVSIDDNIKTAADSLFVDLGIDMSTAVCLFISQAVREQAIPFRISARKPKDITLASEKVLAKEWLSPEEDLIWANL